MEGAIPNVPNSKISACPTVLGQASVPIIGLPTLDGSRSACKWDNDPDAVVPGIFGPSHIPRLFRTDFTHNANDSHWLTNPRQPLTGYPTIIGNEGRVEPRDAPAARHIKHVPLAQQLLGALLAEDGAAVDFRRHLKRDAGWKICLDGAGDDIDRRTLGGHDHMDARGSCHLRKALDRGRRLKV